MNYRLAGISLAAAVLGVGCVSEAQPIRSDRSLGDRIEAALRRGIDEEGLSGAVAAVQRGDDRYLFADGTAVNDDDELTVGTPFVMASVTKTYIAALVLHLVEAGALELDEAVNLEGVPAGVTLRHLLNHTSGLPAGHAAEDITSATAFAADRSVGEPPVCGVGQCFHYGDLNYIALGVFLEEQMGKDVEALLVDFLDDLGLDNTTFAADGRLPPGTVARHDTGEADLEAGADFARHTWTAGAMVSTAGDVLDWARALFGGDVLAEDALAQMLDPTPTMSLPCEGRGCIGRYGLGVAVSRVLGHQVVGHEGSTGTLLAHFPDDDVTIAILGSETGAGRRLLARLAIATGITEHADVWSSDLRGGELQQLTDSPGIDGGPAWSPDGRSVVFGSTRDGQAEVYVMNSDGTNERRLTTNRAHDAAGRFSPDGNRIVFGSDRAGTFDIWTMAADGSDQRRLTTGSGDERLASYSPDARIVFEIGPDGDRDIAVLSADGTDLTVHERPGDQFYASWSPDGERIAFCEPGAGISTMRADGTDVSPVPQMRPSDRFPVWGPDGTLAFTGGEGDIWVTQIDGSERRRVAITVEEEFGVWWSPDGSRLVFPSDR